MKVINLESYGYSEQARKAWEQKGWSYAEREWEDVLAASNEDVDAIIVRLKRKVGHRELTVFPNLKYVLSATTGWDHLDLEELKKRDIKLVSLRGEDEFLKTIPSTAEHTWALIMSLIRNIPGAFNDVKNGGWNRDVFRGYQLQGKVLGIVGLGRTGLKVADYASVFGMKVLFFDPYVTSTAYQKAEDLITLFEKSDIITLHVHLNEETMHMVNEDNIPHIKQGAYLVNTSRGKIWDEQVIVNHLNTNSGKIAGVATDVLSTELDKLEESPIWQAAQNGHNIVITPHLGGATWDAMWTCEEFLVSKM